MPKNPERVIAVLKHVWDQDYKDIEKKPLMDRYWKRNNELGEMFLEIGKSRACKNETKLSLLVNKLKIQQLETSLPLRRNFLDEIS